MNRLNLASSSLVILVAVSTAFNVGCNNSAEDKLVQTIIVCAQVWKKAGDDTSKPVENYEAKFRLALKNTKIGFKYDKEVEAARDPNDVTVGCATFALGEAAGNYQSELQYSELSAKISKPATDAKVHAIVTAEEPQIANATFKIYVVFDIDNPEQELPKSIASVVLKNKHFKPASAGSIPTEPAMVRRPSVDSDSVGAKEANVESRRNRKSQMPAAAEKAL